MHKTKLAFDDSLGGNSNSPNNSLKMNANAPFYQHQHLFVREIHLRGTGWDGSHHQELMLHLQGGSLLRISRNNGEDTFQIGAHAGNYNTLVVRHISANTITCRQVLAAFGNERRLRPTYDHADCRTFAQDIFTALDPGANTAIAEASGGRGDESKLIADLFG
jgi:predicted LPLAT superfamily acyltransferase